MHKPKKLANKVVEQWEQNLLLKVMQRKIKSAKSTISTIQGVKRAKPTLPVVRKPKTCVEVQKQEWTLCDDEQQDCDAHDLSSKCIPTSESDVGVAATSGNKDNCSHFKSNCAGGKSPASEEREIITLQTNCYDDLGYGLEYPINNLFLAMAETFNENFKDSDDDLLSQIWSSCKIENAMFDHTPRLDHQERAGPNSKTTLFYLKPTQPTKLPKVQDKSNHRKQLSKSKKNVVRNPAMVSQMMRKREVGWQE